MIRLIRVSGARLFFGDPDTLPASMHELRSITRPAAWRSIARQAPDRLPRRRLIVDNLAGASALGPGAPPGWTAAPSASELARLHRDMGEL